MQVEIPVLLTIIKRLSVLKLYFGLSFEWPLNTGFTVFTVLIIYIHRSANVQCDNCSFFFFCLELRL